MPLHLPPSVFSWSRLLRLILDLVAVMTLLASMLYVALDGNTWKAAPLRMIPTFVGWVLFGVSLLASDKIYQVYTEWLRGWPRQKQKAKTPNVGLWRCFRKKTRGEFANLKYLTTTETLAARVVGSVMLLHSDVKNGIHRLCSRPSFRSATIVWAIGFSISWCSTLGQWRRESTSERWDFQFLTTSDYAIQEIFLAAATLEFALSFMQQMELLSFVLSPVFWVEMTTLPPCIAIVHLAFSKVLEDYRISQVLLLMGCLRWLKSFVFARFVSSSVVWGSNTKGQIVQLILGISLLLLTFASAMFTAESDHPFHSSVSPSYYAFFGFWRYLYFGVVTMSTVGYGDIHPTTWLGQGLCVVFIVTSLVWIPREFAVLIESFCTRSKIAGSLPLKIFGSSFILLVGDTSPSQLSAFIQETRLRCATPPKLVVLTPETIDVYAQQIQEAQLGRVLLCLVHGEAGIGGVPGDLPLVQPSQARGVFILSPSASFNVFSESQVLTRIMSVLKENVDPTRCCVQLGTETCANAVATMGVTSYTILSDLKMALISRSLSDCPGIIPLITNISCSSYPDVPMAILRHRFSPNMLQHIAEYIRGATHALYSFGVPRCMLELGFEEVAINLFRLAGIITVGVQRNQCSLAVSHQFNCHGVYSNVGNRFVPYVCRTQKHPESLEAPSHSSLTSPDRLGSTELDLEGKSSYWLNPCGKGYILRPGDRLVIIALSVAVAECLQYSTRLPWVQSTYGVKSLVSRLRTAKERTPSSFFSPVLSFRKVSARPSLGTRLPHAQFSLHPSTGVNERPDTKGFVHQDGEFLSILHKNLAADGHTATSVALTPPEEVMPRTADMHIDKSLHSKTQQGDVGFPACSADPVEEQHPLSLGATNGMAVSEQKATESTAFRHAQADANAFSLGHVLSHAHYKTDEKSPTPVPSSVVFTEAEQQASKYLNDLPLERKASSSSEELFDKLNQADTSTLFVYSAAEAYKRKFADPSKPLILICGWPKFLSRLLKKLATGNENNVVVLAAQTPPAWSQLKHLMPYSSFTVIIHGHPLSEVDLMRAGLLEARCIYVFPLALDDTIYEPTASKQGHNDRSAILVYLQMRYLLVHKMDVLQSDAAHERKQTGSWGGEVDSASSVRLCSSQGSHHRRFTASRPFLPHPWGKASRPSPKSQNHRPFCMRFWRRHGSAFLHTSSSVKNSRDGSLKFRAPFLFKRFVRGELLILELQDHDNWRFISDAEWIDRDLQHAPCYSAASYLHSTSFMNGSLFCDRMLYSVITQSPALSEFSIFPSLLMELVGNSLLTSGPGLQLQNLPPYAFNDDGTFGELFETMLRQESKIPLALYRQGLESLEHYVVTCPPQDCLLKQTDRVYVLFTGIEQISLTADRAVKRINAHLARNLQFKAKDVFVSEGSRT